MGYPTDPALRGLAAAMYESDIPPWEFDIAAVPLGEDPRGCPTGAEGAAARETGKARPGRLPQSICQPYASTRDAAKPTLLLAE